MYLSPNLSLILYRPPKFPSLLHGVTFIFFLFFYINDIVYNCQIEVIRYSYEIYMHKQSIHIEREKCLLH